MTSRERLLAAYRLQPVDRVPLRVWGVRCWDPAWVQSKDDSFTPVIEATREHGDFVDAWGPGHGHYGSATSLKSESWTEDRPDWIAHYRLLHTPGGPLRTMSLASRTGHPGMQMEFEVKTLEDLDKVLSVPYAPFRPDVSAFFKLTEEMGDRGLLQCFIPNPISMVHDMMGSDRLAIWSLTDRDRIMEVLWTFQRRCVDILQYLLDQGVGPVFTMNGEEYVTPPLHSTKDFRAFAIEPELEISRLIHEAGGLLHVHCHGPVNAVLEDFAEIGLNCLHPLEPPPMGDVTLADAKRRVGHALCLEGNLQIGDIYTGRTENIVAQVKHNLEVTEGRGYIISPTASPYTPSLEPQTVRNYLAMIEAARQ